LSDFPNNAVVIRFGISTPFWPLSQSYGLFNCPTIRKTFHSPDQYIAYKMLARPEDKAQIIKTPNGYLAHNNLQSILLNARSVDGNPVLADNWEKECDDIMFYCLTLKFTQSAILQEMLMRTGERPIIDDSRSDDPYWCYVGGNGQNKHAIALDKVRKGLLSGEILPMVARRVNT
jgi:predicted NAD-dependent protein-ADP-ribosyltransferase YbiA (DUF1768 family)